MILVLDVLGGVFNSPAGGLGVLAGAGDGVAGGGGQKGGGGGEYEQFAHGRFL
ncbi:hypothetical protein D3C72_1061300 [compost metagenome]